MGHVSTCYSFGNMCGDRVLHCSCPFRWLMHKGCRRWRPLLCAWLRVWLYPCCDTFGLCGGDGCRIHTDGCRQSSESSCNWVAPSFHARVSTVYATIVVVRLILDDILRGLSAILAASSGSSCALRFEKLICGSFSSLFRFDE